MTAHQRKRRQGGPLYPSCPSELDGAYARLRAARTDAELRETLDLIRDLLNPETRGLDNHRPGVM